MADLREQLRRIEAAEPPDLWAGIESRAREERPEVDANIGSVVAFRKPRLGPAPSCGCGARRRGGGRPDGRRGLGGIPGADDR